MSPLDLGSEAVRGRADSQESETYRAQANRPSTRQRTGESASPREVSIESAERKGGAVVEAGLGGYGSPLNTQNINPLYPFQQGGGSCGRRAKQMKAVPKQRRRLHSRFERSRFSDKIAKELSDLVVLGKSLAEVLAIAFRPAESRTLARALGHGPQHPH